MTFPAEAFYRAALRGSIDSTTLPPFNIKVTKVPLLSSWLITLSPNTTDEEIVYYSSIDDVNKTINVTKRGIKWDSQALTTDGLGWATWDFNNNVYMRKHSQGDNIQGDVTHLHLIQDYWDLQNQINNKVNTAGWTRTWLANNAIMRTSWSGVESADVIGSITPISTDTVLMQRDWDIVETPYSNIQALSQMGNSVTEIAWEALALWDVVCIEEQLDFRIVQWERDGRGQYLKVLEAKIGDVVGNTRRSQKIIGNWISGTTIQLGLRKNNSPVDNVTIRIETDDGTGKPTGTLAHINATATIAGSWLSWTALGMTNTTITFAGAFTLTDKTPFHVVVARSWWIDATNYYFLAHITATSIWFTTSLHNGTVWWTPATTTMMCMTYASAYTKIVVKARANDKTKLFFLWISWGAYAQYSSASIQSAGTFNSYAWLTKDTTYYLSNTAWAISITPWTNVIIVWNSDNAWTWVTINSDGKGNEQYNGSILIYTNWWADQVDLQFRATKRASYIYTSSWWSGIIFNSSLKNWVSTWLSWTVFTLNPWDLYQLCYATGGSHATVTLSELVGLNKQVAV